MPSVSNSCPEHLQRSLHPVAMARNTVWNIVGQAVPLIIAAFTIPILIKRLGIDRFGVLTLAWALVGYFSLFDLGIGRALTKVVSDKLACNKTNEVAGAVWSGMMMMVGLGVIFGTAIWLSAHWIVHSILRVPHNLIHETTRAMYPLALCIPVITTSTALRGVLEAQHRFGLTNTVRVSMGAFNFLGPLVVSAISVSVYPVIAILVIGRIVTASVYLILCLKTTPALRHVVQFRREHCGELLSTGAWMTVSNVVGPVMVYLDRFLISAMLSVSLVAYYTTPFEVVTKLWILPVSVTTVLFPAFAALSITDVKRLNEAYGRGLRSTFALLFPAVFLIVLFAPEAMRLWLGPEFERISTPVLRWLAIGVLVNSLAQVPFGLLQAANRSDITAKVHLTELPFYVVLVVAAVHWFGLTGAAVAWTIRLAIEGLVLAYLARRFVVHEKLQARFLASIPAALIVLGIVCLPMSSSMKGFVSVGALAVFATVGWSALLQSDEKRYLKAWLGRFAVAR